MNKRILFPLLVGAALLSGVLYLTARIHGEAEEGASPIYGNVDIREATLSFRVGGRVSQIAVDEGDTIKSGMVLAQLDNPASLTRKRVGLVALERVPVREHTELQTTDGQKIGEVTSGLLGPSFDKPIALAYVDPQHAAVGTRVNAIVRGKAVPMEVCATPFVPTRYYRG